MMSLAEFIKAESFDSASEYKLDEELLSKCEAEVDKVFEDLKRNLHLHFIADLVDIIISYVECVKLYESYKDHIRIGYKFFDKREGTWFEFNMVESRGFVELYIEKQETYRNGLLNGLYLKRCCKDCKAEGGGEYTNGLKTGKWIESDLLDNYGSNSNAGCWAMGIWGYVGDHHGPWKCGHDFTYAFKSVGEYNNGERHGPWIISRNGTIHFVKEYRNDIVIDIKIVNPHCNISNK